MTKPIVRDPIYRKRAFDADTIELCVRWYITYRLSYRETPSASAIAVRRGETNSFQR
jgi:transposase-like protein